MLLDFALEDDGLYRQIVFVQQNDGSFLTDVQGTGAVIDLDGLSRVVGAGADRIFQRDSEGNGLSQTAHQAGDGTGQGFGVAHDGGAVSVNFDFLTAEGILPVGHTGGSQGVGDQDHAFLTKELEGEANDGAVDMNAVADQFGFVVPTANGSEKIVNASNIKKYLGN